MHSRRSLLFALTATGVLAALPAQAGPGRRTARRTVRRTTRRRVRRRHRRRVRRRVVAGRAALVVPVAMAVGWELVDDNTVYVVKAVQPVVIDGATYEEATLADTSGGTKTVVVIREDDDTNGAELEGSQLSDSDTTTPGVTVEITVEE